jgi:Flp pilus assembly protein TadG
LFLAVLFLGFILLTGLVLDASRAQHANAHASDLAAKAARVGAQQIDPASIRAGTYRIDPAAARDAATTYLNERHLPGVRGQVQAGDQLISVTVTWPVRFTLLAPLRRGVSITQTRTVALTTGP